MVFSDAEIRSTLEHLKRGIAREAFIISTCNRTELYALPTDDAVTSDYLIDFLIQTKQLPIEHIAQVRNAFQKLGYCDAITHLFEVIAGIDSQIIGDQQIFAQVKDAFRIAEEAQANGGFITKLAHTAFRVAKRTRTETSLTTGAATISYAAVEFTRKIYDDL